MKAYARMLHILRMIVWMSNLAAGASIAFAANEESESEVLKRLRDTFLGESGSPSASLAMDIVNSRFMNSNMMAWQNAQAWRDFVELPEVVKLQKSGKRLLDREYKTIQSKVAADPGHFIRDGQIFNEVRSSFERFLKRGRKAQERPYTEIEAKRLVEAEFQQTYGQSTAQLIRQDPNMRIQINRRINRYTLMNNPFAKRIPTVKEIEGWKAAEVSRIESRFHKLIEKSLELWAESEDAEVYLALADPPSERRSLSQTWESQGNYVTYTHEPSVKTTLRELLKNPNWKISTYFQYDSNGGFKEYTHPVVLFHAPDGSTYSMKAKYQARDGGIVYEHPRLWDRVRPLGLSRDPLAQLREARRLQLFSETQELIDSRKFLIYDFRSSAPPLQTMGKMIGEFGSDAADIAETKRTLWFRMRYGMTDPNNLELLSYTRGTVYQTNHAFQNFLWGRTAKDPDFWSKRAGPGDHTTTGSFFVEQKNAAYSNLSKEPTSPPDEEASLV